MSSNIEFKVGEKFAGNDLVIEKIVKFYHNGGDFSAINQAEKYLKELGYTWGSMDYPLPTGISKQYGRIAKWSNLLFAEKQLLDGAIVPIGDGFRENDAWVIFFEL